MDNLSISRNIRFYRKQTGKSQEDFAELLGVDRKTFGALERGESPAVKEVIFKMAEFLGIAPENILIGEGYSTDFKTVLNENQNLKEQIDTLSKFYEDKYDGLVKQIEYLCKVNDDQAETIRRLVQLLGKEKAK